MSCRGRRRFGESTAEDPGDDLHQRRATAGSTHQRKRIKKRSFSQKISDRIDSSMEEDKGEKLHPEGERQDQLIDGRGLRRGASSRGSVTGSNHRRKRIKERCNPAGRPACRPSLRTGLGSLVDDIAIALISLVSVLSLYQCYHRISAITVSVLSRYQ